MDYSYSLKPAKRTVVDIPATSRLLKELRNKNGYSVKQLQEIFGFETPVAIYAWENEKCKNIPCIENFDILSKLYNNLLLIAKFSIIHHILTIFYIEF